MSKYADLDTDRQVQLLVYRHAYSIALEGLAVVTEIPAADYDHNIIKGVSDKFDWLSSRQIAELIAALDAEFDAIQDSNYDD